MTPRQQDVLRQVATGASNEAIGVALGIGSGRVKNIIREIADLLPNPRKLPAPRLVLMYAIALRFQETNPVE